MSHKFLFGLRSGELRSPQKPNCCKYSVVLRVTYQKALQYDDSSESDHLLFFTKDQGSMISGSQSICSHFNTIRHFPRNTSNHTNLTHHASTFLLASETWITISLVYNSSFAPTVRDVKRSSSSIREQNIRKVNLHTIFSPFQTLLYVYFCQWICNHWSH